MFIIEHINFSMWVVVFSACFPIDLTMNRNEPNKETNFKREHDFRTPNIQRKTITQRGTVLAPKRNTQRLKSSVLLAMGFLMVMAALGQSAHALDDDPTEFRRIPTQFIAALGDPGATSGIGAQLWGLWRLDPGPRGVRLANFEQLKAAGGVAPAQWEFDSTDWWLEENGLIMEPPDFSVPAGKYVVTGNREVVSVLTIHPADDDGAQYWELDDGATLYDVTHLRCRSARYTEVVPLCWTVWQRG